MIVCALMRQVRARRANANMCKRRRRIAFTNDAGIMYRRNILPFSASGTVIQFDYTCSCIYCIPELIQFSQEKHPKYRSLKMLFCLGFIFAFSNQLHLIATEIID